MACRQPRSPNNSYSSNGSGIASGSSQGRMRRIVRSQCRSSLVIGSDRAADRADKCCSRTIVRVRAAGYAAGPWRQPLCRARVRSPGCCIRTIVRIQGPGSRCTRDSLWQQDLQLLKAYNCSHS
jgi:hypothetical protein